jgi:hypothetical protein
MSDEEDILWLSAKEVASLLYSLRWVSTPHRGDDMVPQAITGVRNKRKFRDIIINKARLNARPAQVKTGYKECEKALCTAKSCWDNWHAQKWL